MRNAHPRSNIKGMRVLVVEDEYLAARSLEMALTGLGCEVVGPASTSEEAVVMIKQEPVDAAVLDINLSPGTCEPVARALRYRSIPFVFITGYSNISVLPDDLRGYTILTKPPDPDAIETAMNQLAGSVKA